MQHRSQLLRREGRTLAFVPTMGFLHEGHLSLLREARSRSDLLVLSIFVNPTQFGAGEDFDAYPRDLSHDAVMAEDVGVDFIFAPSANAMYPSGYATFVDTKGLTKVLCGASRPGHFQGVTTVVTKLFNIVQPDVALFGRKDFQQLAVIERMTADLNLPVDVVGLPIVREGDGLAMSSRNAFLSAEERRQALCLIDGIRLVVAAVREGERDAGQLLELVGERIAREPDAVIDYIRICRRDTLEDVDTVDADSVLLLAVRIGKTRLIDNHMLFEEV